MSEFKKKLRIEKRLELAENIFAKYPDRYPVFVDKKERKDPGISRQKFLVPDNYTIGKLIKEMRNHITSLSEGQGILLYCNNKILRMSDDIRKVYSENKDEDKMLYIVYTVEASFG